MNEDILTHGETMSEEQLLEGLRKTPELKRRLVMRVAADLLESEAFLEAYPHLETEEQIKTALTRLLHKNKVSTIDGRRMAAELAESYEGMYSHSDRSEGPASGPFCPALAASARAALAALPGRSVYFHRSQVMAACSPRLTE